jgi:hypothetical protein
VLLAHPPVDPLPEEIGVATVTRVLLDPVNPELAQGNSPRAEPLVQVEMLR